MRPEYEGNDDIVAKKPRIPSQKNMKEWFSMLFYAIYGFIGGGLIISWYQDGGRGTIPGIGTTAMITGITALLYLIFTLLYYFYESNLVHSCKQVQLTFKLPPGIIQVYDLKGSDAQEMKEKVFYESFFGIVCAIRIKIDENKVLKIFEKHKNILKEMPVKYNAEKIKDTILKKIGKILKEEKKITISDRIDSLSTEKITTALSKITEIKDLFIYYVVVNKDALCMQRQSAGNKITLPTAFHEMIWIMSAPIEMSIGFSEGFAYGGGFSFSHESIGYATLTNDDEVLLGNVPIFRVTGCKYLDEKPDNQVKLDTETETVITIHALTYLNERIGIRYRNIESDNERYKAERDGERSHKVANDVHSGTDELNNSDVEHDYLYIKNEQSKNIKKRNRNLNWIPWIILSVIVTAIVVFFTK